MLLLLLLLLLLLSIIYIYISLPLPLSVSKGKSTLSSHIAVGKTVDAHHLPAMASTLVAKGNLTPSHIVPHKDLL